VYPLDLLLIKNRRTHLCRTALGDQIRSDDVRDDYGVNDDEYVDEYSLGNLLVAVCDYMGGVQKDNLDSGRVKLQCWLAQ